MSVLTIDVCFDSLVWEDRAAIDIDLIRDGNIVAEDRDVLQPRPATNAAVPSNNGAFDPCMVLDLATTQQNAALETHAITNDNIRSNGDIGSDTAVLSNLRRRMNKNITAVDE